MRLGRRGLLGAVAANCAGPGDATGPQADAAVALLWRVEDGDGRFLGSAAAVAAHHALTAWHVVAAGPRFQLRRGTETLAASGAHRLAGTELLLLDLTRPAGPAPALAAEPAPGVPLWLAGAEPDGGTHRAQGVAVAMPPLLALQAPGLAAVRIAAEPGFSGGPLVDAAGALVGILIAAVAESPAEARAIARDASGAPPVRLALYLPVREALRRLPAWDHGA